MQTSHPVKKRLKRQHFCVFYANKFNLSTNSIFMFTCAWGIHLVVRISGVCVCVYLRFCFIYIFIRFILIFLHFRIFSKRRGKATWKWNRMGKLNKCSKNVSIDLRMQILANLQEKKTHTHSSKANRCSFTIFLLWYSPTSLTDLHSIERLFETRFQRNTQRSVVNVVIRKLFGLLFVLIQHLLMWHRFVHLLICNCVCRRQQQQQQNRITTSQTSIFQTP